MNFSFCIDKTILGTNKHFVYRQGSYLWSNNVPDYCWWLNGEQKLNTSSCLDTLAILNGIEINTTPPERFIKAMQQITSSSISMVPWRYAMPKEVHETYSKELVNQVIGILNNASKDYYKTVWVPGNKVLNALVKAKINVEEYNKIVSENEGNQPAVKTFKPIAGGYSNEITYNRFGTRTGRLTVKTGPLILTIKKEHRKRLLGSRFKGGKILEIDFANLEPRIMLHEAGKSCIDVDLYKELNDKLFASRGARNIIKQAVISQLYGISKNTLQKLLNVEMSTINTFVSVIADYFEIKNLLEKIKSEFLQKGYITNKFGRRVHVDVPIDRMFVNSWAQSTGSDVAMLGFEKIINRFEDRRINPLYLIVDAMLVDVHPNDVPFVKSLSQVEIGEHIYPVKITEY